MANGCLIRPWRRRGDLRRLGAIVLIGLIGWIWAPDAVSSDRERPTAERGHAIDVGGGPGGAGAACFSCHGLQGQGDAGAAFPGSPASMRNTSPSRWPITPRARGPTP